MYFVTSLVVSPIKWSALYLPLCFWHFLIHNIIISVLCLIMMDIFYQIVLIFTDWKYSFIPRHGRNLLAKTFCRFSFLLHWRTLLLHLVISHLRVTTCYYPFCKVESVIVAQMNFWKTACWLADFFLLNWICIKKQTMFLFSAHVRTHTHIHICVYI